ncbi:OmpH family outer membrane protein [Halodesulfovibrio aestuarii]|uniref:Periplasmic chaperone for outer membrane proteins Skp n=1 Tax=Halodesulfovibrio aestuarii TaxID=126333 RepID=A0A8G2C855_9BACT|nr:OmpH family outer membrane protein [Halodesulfovibrio aestuarii]SHI76372.1 periplasmic chaperone for outer membrane proteins Skp [Halodesulfovibrio aestuarii]
MKKLVLLCVAIFCLALVGCNQDMNAGSSPKVAVVDPAKVFQDCQPGKDGMAYLEKVSVEVQQQFKALQEEAAKKKGQNAETVTDIQAQVSKIQARVSAEQQMVVTKLNDLFQKVLEQYRKENGVAVVIPIEQALSYDKSADATAAVVAIMNKETVTFESPVATAVEKNTANEQVAPESAAGTDEMKPQEQADEMKQEVTKQTEEKQEAAPVDAPDVKDAKK